MRIAYIYAALNTISGGDRMIVQKANYFADRYGYEVFVITAHQCGAPVFFPLSERVTHIDLGVDFTRQYGKPLWQRALIYYRLLKAYKRKLSALLVDLKADIVLTTISRDVDFLFGIGDGSIKIAESHTPKAFVRNLHLLEEKGGFHRIVGKIWMHKLRRAINRLDGLVVLTGQDAKEWEAIKEAYVIQNAFPFYPDSQSSCTEKKVISVGRLEHGKGYDTLIRAWRKVVDRFPDWTIHVYGRGTLEAELRRLIEAQELTNHFFIESPVAAIQEKYLESSFFVMSSSFEGLPMVLIEAMACGIPTISFDCPVGPAEVIGHEDDGFLVENGNVDELVEKICCLIADDDRRKRMGEQARRNVMRFHPDVIMKKWDDLFNRLTAAGIHADVV